jgi:hypothetical protein
MAKARRYLPTLLLALGVLATTPACAARIYATSRGGYSRDFERRAYEFGVRAGRKRGYDDMRHRRDFSYSRHSTYRSADNGYRRGDGDRDAYRRTFRRGFESGYSEGFSQRGDDRGRGHRR